MSLPIHTKNYQTYTSTQKESKLLCSNYGPNSLSFNVDKIIEKIMYSGIFKFLDKTNIMYLFHFHFRQQLHML